MFITNKKERGLLVLIVNILIILFMMTNKEANLDFLIMSFISSIVALFFSIFVLFKKISVLNIISTLINILISIILLLYLIKII